MAPVSSLPRPFVIAHLSDLHCGSPYFVENLLQRAIMQIVLISALLLLGTWLRRPVTAPLVR